MRALERTTKFKRDYKREKKTDPALDDALVPVLELILADAELPERLSDHSLSGEWRGFRDCHVKRFGLDLRETRGIAEAGALGIPQRAVLKGW